MSFECLMGSSHLILSSWPRNVLRRGPTKAQYLKAFTDLNTNITLYFGT